MAVRVNINEEKCCWLLDGVKLSGTGRVLVSWHEVEIAGLLRRVLPDINIEYLTEMDTEAFIRQKKRPAGGRYDFIFDSGLLADVRMDGQLLRSLGMQLKSGGRLRMVLPESLDRNLAGRCAYANNFNRSILISAFETGGAAYYVAELSDFQREVTWLQSFYTPELRREMAFLLQRIDFDVYGGESVKLLKLFVKRYGIDADYLRFFVDSSVVHKEKLYRLL